MTADAVLPAGAVPTTGAVLTADAVTVWRVRARPQSDGGPAGSADRGVPWPFWPYWQHPSQNV